VRVGAASEPAAAPAQAPVASELVS
jgi:hypothetical protein